MPLRECSIVSQREEFCRLALQPGSNISALCRRWKIGRTTAHGWIGRYKAKGVEGLLDQSRRPKASPLKTVSSMEDLVVAVRRAHSAWGGRKIQRVLKNDGVTNPPAISTITQILRRHDLLDGPGAGETKGWVRFEHPAPNELWQMDFKGHVQMDQGRCHPLTVLDDHSRYALEIGACGDERTETVKERLEKVFERYGLPRRMLADNGPPWGTAGAGHNHTRLSVWLMDLDITLAHGRAYHPQTQGKDERFHRTLKAEVLHGRIFAEQAQAQSAFDRWREVYNHRRPHEGIGMEVPSSRYVASPREMPKHIEPPHYEDRKQVRRVHDGGWINFKGKEFACPKAFAGRDVILRPTSTDGVFDLCYRRHVLTQINLR
jgi:transposase InsO family protein